MKYKSKKIDYSGCNPIIAEHLQRGEAVLCRDSDGRKCYVTSYEPNPPSYRVMLCDIRSIVWRDNIKPIPTIHRIMPPERAIPVLIAEGWRFTKCGEMYKPDDSNSVMIRTAMFVYMGEELPSHGMYPDCIIEDVDE